MEKIKYYELKQVMHQSNEQFINILNWFQIATHLQLDVDNITNQCFCTSSNDPKFSYLFYMNETKQKIMNWFSLEAKGMYSYCMLKMGLGPLEVLQNIFHACP